MKLSVGHLMALVKAFVVFWILVALAQAIAGLSAVLIAFVVILAIAILRILARFDDAGNFDRKDVVCLIIGAVLGVVLALVFNVSAKGVGDVGILFVAGLLVGLQL